MPSTEWTIRVATPADAERLTRFAEQIFRDTFGEMNTAEDMEMYCAAAFSATIQRDEIENQATETLLVDQGDEVIAYAQVHAGLAPESVGGNAPLELKRFYVATRYHRNGLAPALMVTVIARARAAGADPLWLGVWERNPRAIRFYEKHGFVQVGDHSFLLGTERQRDVLMALR